MISGVPWITGSQRDALRAVLDSSGCPAVKLHREVLAPLLHMPEVEFGTYDSCWAECPCGWSSEVCYSINAATERVKEHRAEVGLGVTDSERVDAVVEAVRAELEAWAEAHVVGKLHPEDAREVLAQAAARVLREHGFAPGEVEVKFVEDTAICEACGAKVPIDLLPEHLAEHDTSITAQQVREAPVVLIDDPDEEPES